jgi:hypothetical protein
MNDGNRKRAADVDRLARLAMLLGPAVQPRPLLRTVVAQWERLAALDAPDDTPLGTPLRRLAIERAMAWLLNAELNAAAGLAFRDAALKLQVEGADRYEPVSEVVPAAQLLRRLARIGLPLAAPKTRLLAESIELATTIAIGLDKEQLFPNWTLDEPRTFAQRGGYADWARALQQKLDRYSLRQWLERHDIAKDFVPRSRILDAVTAGLFTTPDKIAAGTFVNGFIRLFLTYERAPYKRLPGGTGEAVIGPIYKALLKKAGRGVTVRLGHTVTSLSCAEGQVTGFGYKADRKTDPSQDFGHFGPGRDGWLVRAEQEDGAKTESGSADAYVLAIPPFACRDLLQELPQAVQDSLSGIEHCATIGVQHWTDEMPLHPRSITSGLPGPLRCAAPMDHLAGAEFQGAGSDAPPVYYCGDVDEDTAKAWDADPDAASRQWLSQHASAFQPGPTARKPHVSVNREGSERYVMATVDTQAKRPHVFQTGGIGNLWFAGDWTRSALCCGSIEAAVTSGLEAARHILQQLGCTVRFPIVGPIFEAPPRKTP